MGIALDLFNQVTAGWTSVEKWKNDGISESVHLEFKRKKDPAKAALDPDDLEGIAKAVSGLANTEGGVLAFGFQAQGQGKPDKLQGIHHLQKLEEVKFNVERQVRLLTNPPVAGLRVESIEDPSRPGQGVVAVYVPQSLALPHRAISASTEVNDRYFMRTVADTVVMPHAMLAALFGRTPPPRLQLRLEFCTRDLSGTQAAEYMTMRLANVGRGTARQPAVCLREESQPIGAFWWNSLIHATLASGWNNTSVERGADTTVTLRSGPEVLLYPGDELLIARG